MSEHRSVAEAQPQARLQPQPRHRPAPASRPLLRLVTAEQSGGRATTRLWTAVASVGACAVVFAVVALHVVLSQGQMDLDRLHDRADAEAARNRSLRVQVAELEAPNRIVTAARQRLGMVAPASIVYLPAATGPLAPIGPLAPPTGTAQTGPTAATKATAPAPKPATPTKPTTPTTPPARSTATTRPAGRAR